MATHRNTSFRIKFFLILGMFLKIIRLRLAITKLDILDQLEEVKVAIGYTYNGQKLETYPGMHSIFFKFKTKQKIIVFISNVIF